MGGLYKYKTSIPPKNNQDRFTIQRIWSPIYQRELGMKHCKLQLYLNEGETSSKISQLLQGVPRSATNVPKPIPSSTRTMNSSSTIPLCPRKFAFRTTTKFMLSPILVIYNTCNMKIRIFHKGHIPSTCTVFHFSVIKHTVNFAIIVK